MFTIGDVVYCTINKCNGIVFSNECKAHTYNPIVVGFPDGSVSHYTIDGRPARTREIVLSVISKIALFKIGDKVKCSVHSKSGKIVSMDYDSSDYRILVRFEDKSVSTYTVDGLFNTDDTEPSLSIDNGEDDHTDESFG